MKRILLIAAMLLPLTSAMAAVTITAVDEGEVVYDGVIHHTISIQYSAVDVNVRAFALDINVDNGTNIGDTIRDFNTGESIDPNTGYGIFPSRFRDFIDPQNPDWGVSDYNPTTAWDEPGAENTGLGWPKMVVELGTLYSGDGNQPEKSGTLFRFDVNSEGAEDCNLRMVVDDLRGGVVGEDAVEITPVTFVGSPLYIAFLVPPDAPTSITYPATSDNGRDTVSWVPAVTGGPADSYNVERNNGGGYTPIYSGPDTSFLTDEPNSTSNTYRVQAHNGAGDSGWTTGTGPCVVAYCYYGADYTSQWLVVGRPRCWCYPRQCHGDADGKSEGMKKYWVSTNDLTILTNAWNKTAAQLYVAPDPNACADFDHAGEGMKKYRASTNDLTILSNNWNQQNLPAGDCNPGNRTP